MNSHTDDLSAAAHELNVFCCELAGTNLIEASAGTGKTWTICALYLRLLLQAQLSVEQILVVTFTRAATAELHERIRERISHLLPVCGALLHAGVHSVAEFSALSSERQQQLANNDPFVQQLFIALAKADPDTASPQALSLSRIQRRLTHALRNFDTAAILTIHSFCQRALQETPFAAGMPFDFELIQDDRPERLALALEFWRTHIEPAAARDISFAAWLIDRKATPDMLDAYLTQRLQKPLAQAVWESASGGDKPLMLEDAYTTAKHLWQTRHAEIAAALQHAQPALKRTSYTPERIRTACDAWDTYFAAGILESLPTPATRIGLTALQQGLKKGATLTGHPFFAAADALMHALYAREQQHQQRWLSLLKEWLEWAPPTLVEQKKLARTVSFNDLLSQLHDALRSSQWLTSMLRQRYAAALIDEFQDTDPLQFDIFSRIFTPADASPTPLFLVGDPKQAIYRFRAADLYTYLAARAAATHRYTLAVNQRSTPALIDACNRFFGANPNAFILRGLHYHTVRAGTRSRALLQDPDDADPLSAAALRIWRLPSGSDILSKQSAQRLSAHACAAEIVRLLTGYSPPPYASQNAPLPQGGEGPGEREEQQKNRPAQLGDRPVAPGDIAILVQTNKQAALMRSVLAEWDIASVESSQASVFACADAACFERMLSAIEQPSDRRRLHAALASDWIGLDAQDLSQLLREDDALPLSDSAHDAASWIERFTRYRRLLLERGFTVMWHVLLPELGVRQRLARLPDGERRLTNLAHLAELAHQQTMVQPDIASLLRWLNHERAPSDSAESREEAQLRLESDRNRVEIVTVHKAKGLEYPIVFCPFLNDNPQPRTTSRTLPDVREYRTPANTTVLHYGNTPEIAARAQEQAHREQAAERVRLIYVALTRAIYRCYLVSGPYTAGTAASITAATAQSRKSVLEWLIAGRGYDFDTWQSKPPELDELEPAWQTLALSSATTISLQSLPDKRSPVALTTLLQTETPAALQYAARLPRRSVHDSWKITSFTALTARSEESSTQLSDNQPLSQSTSSQPIAIHAFDSQVRRDADDILDFPRGAIAGACLHRLFELVDFSQPSGWPAAVTRALHECPVPADASLAARLPAMMMRLLKNVSSTPLVSDELPQLTLDNIAPGQRLTEMAFLFPAHQIDLERLAHVLDMHGYRELSTTVHALAANNMSVDGYLTGFIDLVFEYDGRFWLLDWKSNFLGEQADDYNAAQLNTAMQTHRYTLQALLYSVALHRHLRHRLADYDYARHFGGCLFVFLRAIRDDWQNDGKPLGIWRDRFPLELLEAIDESMKLRNTHE